MSRRDDNERTALLAVEVTPQETRYDEEQQLTSNSGSGTLFNESTRNTNTKERPFPWGFALSIYVLCCVSPLGFELIFPFVNQMILENGITTEPERVGFYSGLIESIFALMSFISIMPCTYISDHVGRKPVVLAGTVGLALSIGLFGMAKSYWFMFVTRLIGGTLGGTNATIKVMLAEAVDKSQQGLAFSGFVIAYRMGQIIGQPMGGLLAHPERNFKTFDTPFWHKYPFALPCYIASTFAVFAAIFGYFAIQETSPLLRNKKNELTYGTATPPDTEQIFNTASTKPVRPSVRSVLTPQVVGALFNSSLLAFSSEMIFALYPLFAFTPIDSGGLGLMEAQIGAQLGFRSLNNVLVILLYAPMERRIGTMRLYQLTMAFWPLSMVCFPLLNALARHGWEGTWAFQVFLGTFFTIWSFACLSWTASNIIVNNASPSAEALSVVNSIAQMALTLPLAIAPGCITSAFAFSIKHEAILNGNLVYVFMLIIGLVGTINSLTLKDATHDWREDAKSQDEGEEAD